MREQMISRACELLANGSVDRVIGWERGEFVYDVTPAVFNDAEDLKNRFVFDLFCGANLSKYLVSETAKGGKVLAFLKPCDTYSFNQLLAEHRVKRENFYIIGVECNGMADINRIREAGASGIKSISSAGDKVTVSTVYGDREFTLSDVIAERCSSCKSRHHVIYDELMGKDGEVLDSNRFDMVEKLEKMTPDERFEFWRGELSRCIRCNACRNVCPACTCEKCIFDNASSGFENKAAADTFEENMFHIIRAFHVAGRCTDCGECSRVCPAHIPLHLLNRKFIKDINELYGDYQAGAEVNERGPLVNFTQDDANPSIVNERGNG